MEGHGQVAGSASIKSRGVTPGGAMFLSVLEAQNTSEQQSHANIATFGASSLLFSYFLSFHSFPCSCFGPGPCGCVPRETSWNFLCRSSCSLRLFLLFLEILAGSWMFVDTETMEGHGQVAGSASIKSRGVTPGGAMFLSVLEAQNTSEQQSHANIAIFGASSLLFSYFLSFHSFPCSCFGPGPCGCVPREISWKFLCRSSCSLRLFLLFLEILAGSWMFVDTETMEGHGQVAGSASL